MVRLIKIVFVVAVVVLGALYFFGYDGWQIFRLEARSRKQKPAVGGLLY